MYAIKNRKTGQYITGTNYRYNPPHQITSGYHGPLLFPVMPTVECLLRQVSMKYYKIVMVELVELTEKI